jgi:hypothetical protein
MIWKPLGLYQAITRIIVEKRNYLDNGKGNNQYFKNIKSLIYIYLKLNMHLEQDLEIAGHLIGGAIGNGI